MSDIKIGDRVTGIKGNKRVTGTVMNIKEGHVHIKAPVSGVYAPLVSIVPLHKITKLDEGAMKRKAEAEDDAGMSDYMHHVQTSSAPFDNAKPAKPHQDKFGNKIKIGNVAKNLAKQGMRGVKKEEVETIDEWRHSENERHSKRIAKGMSPEESHAKMKKTRDNEENARREKRAAAKLAKEEVEQIDEVGDTKKGKDALASYITKAARQSSGLRGLGVGFDNDKNMYAKKALRARTPETKEKARADMETSGRLSSRFNRKSYNRTTGISRAAVRLAKEEVEQIYEEDIKKSKVMHNGKEIGEVGIDTEASPGNGKWYAKHHASGMDTLGHDSKKDAVEEVHAAHREMNEEVEQIDEVGPQKRLKRVFNKLRDARAGAAYKQSGMPVPDRESGHKNTVDHNKALGRALRKMSEDLHSRKVYEPTSAQELNPGLRAKIDAASNAQKPAPAGRRPIGKIKLMTRKEEVEQVDELSQKTLGNYLKAKDEVRKKEKEAVFSMPKTISRDRTSKKFANAVSKHHQKWNIENGTEVKHTDRAEDRVKAFKAGSTGSKKTAVGTKSSAGVMAKYQKKGAAYKKAVDAVNKQHGVSEEVEQVEEGYKGRRAFGSAYDKTHDPFQDSKRAFKSRELEHELAHEAPSGPAHHDQTPHDVHIDGKKWKTFGSAGHAHNIANKLSISGKRASVHKTPIAEKAPPGWEGTVKAMKKHSEIDNPFALAWWMKRKGAKSHKGEK
jgi:hypothetical protein